MQDPTDQTAIDNFMVQELDGTVSASKSLEQMPYLRFLLRSAKLEQPLLRFPCTSWFCQFLLSMLSTVLTRREQARHAG
ncbi:hypothetical protein MLD38_020339 [Melastoma candidum]|uniref:Uncharacterized protein n=1 Tax=Melastoma candidum TaxID=119954 RepID=A0ACB9QC23_9MYRT|nr:hypothetical protein MLD38_020339 [Melastoma candidum]